MGGKALVKYGVHTERKNTKEFNQIGYIMEKQVFKDLSFFSNVVKCYHTKSDHGDLDLLISVIAGSNVNWKEYITKTFKPRAIHHNANVYSFDYDNFQIDFILIDSEISRISEAYYSYDPLGNLMGKSFHKFNLSYGWNGLYYKYRNFNGNNSENILISTDPSKIFKFGGYCYETTLIGFENLEDIYKYVINGKYFNGESLQLHNLTQIDRKRNRKRVSYNTFIKYLEDNKIDKTYQFSKNKADYLPMINSFFPEANLQEKLATLDAMDRENKIISTKFNGDMVMMWLPELQGKQLGAAIAQFKEHLGDEYRDFVLNGSFLSIKNEFMAIYDGERK